VPGDRRGKPTRQLEEVARIERIASKTPIPLDETQQPDHGTLSGHVEPSSSRAAHVHS